MTTYELITKIKNGDKEAESLILQQNVKLIYMVVNRFADRAAEKDDLFQLAAIGFIKAVRQFDISLNTKLSTYAVPMMLGEIKRYLRDTGPVKVSRYYKTLAYKASLTKEKIIQETKKEPSLSELAMALGIEVSELSVALSAAQAIESLDEPIKEDGLRLKDTISTENEEGKLITSLTLQNSLKKLSEREKYIIVLRYMKEQTQSSIAKKLGISQVQVSRLEKKILEKLKDYLEVK